MYDLVSGRKLLRSSYVVGKTKALELFPMLNKEKLCGAIIYYDGTHSVSTGLDYCITIDKMVCVITLICEPR